MAVFTEKCLEEVKGREELLLRFVDSCFVVEAVFGKCRQGALGFLLRLQRAKKPRRLQLLFTRSAECTIERLLFALVPLAEEHQEVSI